MTQDRMSFAMEAHELTRVSWPPLRWLTVHPRVLDWIVVLVCTGVQRVALVVAGNPANWTAYLTLGLTGAALLWRRRYPLSVLTIVVAISCINSLLHPEFGYQNIPFVVALYTIASRQPLKRAVAGYAIGVAVPAITAIIQIISEHASFSPTVLDPIALLALTIGLTVRSQRERRQALTELINQQLENARITERTRVSAEMHDVVAHSLSVMIALANGASAAWQKHPERAADALRDLSAVGRTAQLDVRRILQILHDSDADSADALLQSGHNLPNLAKLIQTFRSTGLPVSLRRKGVSCPEDTTLTMTIYRIVQESLTNSLRHATDATQVVVTVSCDEHGVDIVVSDNGKKKTNVSPGSGHGLPGIEARAKTYNGASVSGPLPSGGWRTTVHLQFANIPQASSDE